MKNSFTLKVLIIFIFASFFSAITNAQDATYTVGTDGPHLTNLWNTKIRNNADLTDGSTITINFPEGKWAHPYTSSNLKHVVNVIIQGAGADKTFVMKDTTTGLEQQPNGRLIFFNGAADNPAGSKVIVKDMTLVGFNFIGTGDAGTVACLQSGVIGLDVSFVNCNFMDNAASRGAFSIVGDDCNLELDNCFFGNSTSFVGSAGLNGLIWVRQNSGEAHTNSVSITNCTFMTDTAYVVSHNVEPPADMGQRNGSVLDLQSGQGENALELLLEDNVFIDNKVEPDASTEFIQPAVSLKADSGSVVTAEMNNNIFIGNRRSGTNMDADIYVEGYQNEENVEITAADNIATKMLQRVMVDDTVETFEDLVVDGFIVHPDYTYTTSTINFTMDGDLPAITMDESGVKHVMYTGDGGVGVKDANTRSFKVYPNPSQGMFEVNLSGISGATRYQIYNINGSLVKEGIFKGDINRIDMRDNAKGMYILRINGDKPGCFKLLVK